MREKYENREERRRVREGGRQGETEGKKDGWKKERSEGGMREKSIIGKKRDE